MESFEQDHKLAKILRENIFWLKFSGAVSIILGIVMCLTISLVIVGPMPIRAGFLLWRAAGQFEKPGEWYLPIGMDMLMRALKIYGIMGAIVVGLATCFIIFVLGYAIFAGDLSIP